VGDPGKAAERARLIWPSLAAPVVWRFEVSAGSWHDQVVSKVSAESHVSRS